MVHLLESKGIRVFSLAENCAEVDAYSVWRGLRPFIFLNMGKSGERRRFDAAHELGHLLLHRSAANGPGIEKEAQEFAAAFLMPTASMRALGRVPPSMDSIMRLKKSWNVSAAAMAMRLHDVGLFSYYHYNRLFVELSRKGFRSSEPGGLKPETSQVWGKVLLALRREGGGVTKLAEELGVPPAELVGLIFGLVTVGLPVNEGLISPQARPPSLRLVK
jgi:Zn-dependent peptidase ImmA (M78 family)